MLLTFLQLEADPEWGHIDHVTLEEVKKSFAHSRCREIRFDISGSDVEVGFVLLLVFVC